VRHTLTIAVAMLSMAAGAWHGASHAQQSSSPPSADERRQFHVPEDRTYTGCVRAGEASDSYVLVVLDQQTPDAAAPQAAQASAPAPGAPGAGTTGTSGVTRKVTTYELVPGRHAARLQEHLGRRVTVRGRVVGAAEASIAAERQPGPVARGDTTTPDLARPVERRTERTAVVRQRLQVRTLETADGTCP
jgi:hypothetical protein